MGLYYRRCRVMPAEGRSPGSRAARKREQGVITGESLTGSDKVRKLQTVLHAKAKEEPGLRFHALIDRAAATRAGCRWAGCGGGGPDVPRPRNLAKCLGNLEESVVHRLLYRGHNEVVDCDLSNYFGEIPHAELMKSLARRINGFAVRGHCHQFAERCAVPVAGTQDDWDGLPHWAQLDPTGRGPTSAPAPARRASRAYAARSAK